MSEYYNIREVGQIIGPNLILWEDGELEECELPHDLPPEYLGGRGFRAVVVRDEDWKFVDILCIEDYELPTMTSEEFTDLLARIPTTRSLPDADWE